MVKIKLPDSAVIEAPTLRQAKALMTHYFKLLDQHGWVGEGDDEDSEDSEEEPVELPPLQGCRAGEACQFPNCQSGARPDECMGNQTKPQ